MRLTPENIRSTVRNFLDYGKQVDEKIKNQGRNLLNTGNNVLDTFIRKPSTPVTVAESLLLAGGIVVGGAWGWSANIQPVLDERSAKVAVEKAAKAQAKQDAIRRDFEETAGANLLRGESNSMAVTLRKSSSLAGSRTDFLLGVWDRIHRETGCDIGSTTHFEVKPRFLWTEKEPESYAVTVINCPPTTVKSAQSPQ